MTHKNDKQVIYFITKYLSSLIVTNVIFVIMLINFFI